MSKRKLDELELSSGDSSDDAAVNAPATKKPTAPWAPVRLSMQPSRPFQQPTRAGSPSARLSQVTPSSSRLKSKPGVASLPPHMRLPTPQGTPSLDNDTGSSSDSESPDAPSASVSKKAEVHTKIVVATATTNTTDPLARSRLALEKQLNDLSNTLEENERRHEERHRQNEEWHRQNTEYQERTEKKFDQVLGAIAALDVQLKERPTTAGVPTPMTIAPSAKLTLTNPPITDELTALIKRVVKSKAQWLEDRKKGESTAEENTKRDHSRQTMYGMLGGIKQAKDIPPPFFNEQGLRDVFPKFAVDPETSYCQPYPDWTSQLSNQPEWVPTYLERFRKTIPNNNSASSVLLRGLSDEEIIAYMHDGPFTTARTSWRSLAKSDEAVREMQSEVRQKWRLDQAVAKRTAYRKEIPSVQGPEHNWLFHREAMSRQVSDDEGNVITYSPQWHASWVRKLWNSVDSAELQKAMKKRGLCPRPRAPTFGKGPSSLPQVTKMSPNGHEVPVLIAYCGLKRAWRHENREFIDSSPHLVDKSINSTPSTADFVSKYPAIVYSKPDEDRSASGPAEAVASDNEGLEAKGWDEAPFELDGGEAADDEDEDEVLAHTNQQDVSGVIDPELQEATEARARPRPRMIVPPLVSQPEATAIGSTFGVPQVAAATQVATVPVAITEGLGTDPDELDPPPTGVPPPHFADPFDPGSVGYQLPPPPTLLRQAQAAAELAASQVPADDPAQPLTKKRVKKKAPMPVAGPSTTESVNTGGEPSAHQGPNTLGGETGLPKKRGRPLGSKNKKKAQE